ncbi:MAG: hypothetical protein A2599_02725 [Candidatus Staskawiczbacteria bacterium RIFOXYD1_FULL_39_28]|uniref:Uncharacterized protein n=1 Tax=Candidatus Staskawiczbacteria bacterium RIFOXYC1_FULL_38_18 TaxID=1802229 RepID=A0A1G2JC73_9BACT|nr:MAG: hypothetical protein A2401_01225 [Candidatus Staskawiczbacteria bacterium RIFOXYC1_FULL_38_18]OGZ91025.1 MAG: hypothetical protein A2599_02725 [Candidatus Staskawiczbacteria bacterium RIFOXYD1_FULL_39_28]
MSKSNPDGVLIFIIIFLVGAIIGSCISLAFLNKYSTSPSVSIDPIDGISIFVNVLLVIYVTRTLTRKNEEERVEKEILIKQLQDFQDCLDNTITRLLSTEKLKLVAVNANLKTLRRNFNSIRELLKKYNFISQAEDNDICNTIDAILRDIKDFFTDTPRTGENGEKDVGVNQDEISLGAQNRQGIDDSTMKAKGKIFELVVLINRKE